jgi:hypothetical protein
MPLLDFPPDMYQLRPGEPPLYGAFPELTKCVQWFISQLPTGEWPPRREAVAKRFYQTLVHEFDDPTGEGRYFDNRDMFGWYLFLGEAYTDHPWNYEVTFGCRVIPILAAIGGNLEILERVEGFSERARAIASAERSQPNAGLFEILVAAAYARAGWLVKFKPVKKGIAKTYDLDIEKNGRRYAVECKRMEGGEYHEQERARMRELWKLPCLGLTMKEQRSTYLEVRFKIELKDVPDTYLLHRVYDFLNSKMPSRLWDDNIASGVVGDLDLDPIQESLKTGYLLHPGPVFNKLLTGSYRRYDSIIEAIRLKYAVNPHFIDALDLAVIARWSSHSEAAIEKKARDIQAKLVEANRQLPPDIPGIVHIGFEAIAGDTVEQRRYEKIIERVQHFNRAGSRLEFLYCHYFSPESTPEETWAIDETFQWVGIRKMNQPLSKGMLLGIPSRVGVHWDGKVSKVHRLGELVNPSSEKR